MRIYQQLLTVISDDPVTSINETAQKMIASLIKEVKKNRSSRKDGDLIYEIKPESYSLPMGFCIEKKKTKWEKFAESKGIKKRKKSQLEYSKELKKWVPRWGSKSVRNLDLSTGIIESEKSLSQLKAEKKRRKEKNKKNRIANKKRFEL